MCRFWATLVLKVFFYYDFSTEVVLLSLQKPFPSYDSPLNNGLYRPSCYVPGPTPLAPVATLLLLTKPLLLTESRPLFLLKSINWCRSRDAVRVEIFCWWMVEGEWLCSNVIWCPSKFFFRSWDSWRIVVMRSSCSRIFFCISFLCLL